MNVLFINTMDKIGGPPRVMNSLRDYIQKQGDSSSAFVKHKYSNDQSVYVARWQNPFSRLLKKITGKDLGSILSAKFHYLAANDIEYFNSDKLLHTKEFRQADIVHCHNLHGNYFKLDTLRKIARQKPVVWTFHDMWPITAHCSHSYGLGESDGFYQCPSLNSYQELLWDNSNHLASVKKYTYEKTDFHIVAPCGWLKDLISDSLLKTHPISVIYNGIDTNIFRPMDKNQARDILSLPKDKRILLFVASNGVTDEKGGGYYESVAKSFENDDNTIFVCVGGFSKTVTRQKNNILYVPFINDKKILASYYGAADIFLFASLAETFPLVVLEALSAGLPVVSFDVGGTKEAVIHKEHGYIARYKDTSDLINGLREILKLTPNKFKKMSEDARQRTVGKFSVEMMCEKYYALYRSLAAQRPVKNNH